jgi:hypothetical protein
MHDFIDTLSWGRSKDNMEAYYKRNVPPEGVKVDFRACSGKGLYADNDFEAGDEIFGEKCLVGLQVKSMRCFFATAEIASLKSSKRASC